MARDANNHQRTLAPLILIGLFCVLTLPLLLTGRSGQSELGDQNYYHLPVIERFSQELPSPDIVDYDSATAPGYHLLLAVIHRASGDSLAALSAFNWLASLMLVISIYASLRMLTTPWRALVFALPVTISTYTLGGATAINTDNAATLFLVLTLMAVVFSRKWTEKHILTAGLFATLAVATRQIHLWLIAPIGLACLLATPFAHFIPRAIRHLAPEARKFSNLWLLAPTAGLPVLVVLTLIALWGGLVPATTNYEISKHAMGMNPAAYAYALSFACISGVLYAPLVYRRGMLKDRMVWIAFAIGLLLAIPFPTSVEQKVRSVGWFWGAAVRHTPVIEDRSLLICVMAPIGAACIAMFARAASDAGRGATARVLLLTMLGWLIAQSMNTMAWQKYYEPVVLILFAWLAALALPRDRAETPQNEPREVPRWAWLGAFASIAMQIGLSAVTLYREAYSG